MTSHGQKRLSRNWTSVQSWLKFFVYMSQYKQKNLSCFFKNLSIVLQPAGTPIYVNYLPYVVCPYYAWGQKSKSSQMTLDTITWLPWLDDYVKVNNSHNTDLEVGGSRASYGNDISVWWDWSRWDPDPSWTMRNFEDWLAFRRSDPSTLIPDVRFRDNKYPGPNTIGGVLTVPLKGSGYLFRNGYSLMDSHPVPACDQNDHALSKPIQKDLPHVHFRCSPSRSPYDNSITLMVNNLTSVK